jgi:hypothetical protein
MKNCTTQRDGNTYWLVNRSEEHFFSYIMARRIFFQQDDDEVRFVLDQHAELDLYSAGLLKQQSAGRHVTSHSDTLF